MTALLGYCDPISAAPGRARALHGELHRRRALRRRDRAADQPAGRTARDAVPHRARRDAGQPQPSRAPPGDPDRLVRRGRRPSGVRRPRRASRSRPTSGRPRPAGAARRCSAPGRRASGGASASASTLRARSSCASATARRSRCSSTRAAAARAPLVPGRRQLRCGERPPLPLADAGPRPLVPRSAAGRGRERRPRSGPHSAGAPFLFAAWHEGEAAAPTAYGRLVVGGHYNGKLDRPRLAERALEPGRDPGARRRRRAALRASSGRWSRAGTSRSEIPSERLIDSTPNRLHGRTVNLPARAMTGHNWTGAAMDWTRAPEQYGAIHFHDDDLVDASWQADFELEVPADLRSGVYAARLSAQEAEFYVPFFVRPPRGTRRAPRSPISPRPRPISPTSTTAAASPRSRPSSTTAGSTVLDAVDDLLLEYPEVGLSTYDRHSDGSGVAYSSRLRPATNIKPTGRHWNFNLDLFIIDWLEHLGVDYDVITEEDLHDEGLDLLRPYDVVLTGSHPEYDSLAMLDALDGYLRQGGRLMYMGGNGFYWRIAHHPTRRGVIEVRRAEGGVRAWDALPGEYYHSFTGEYGGLWRRQGRAPQKLAGRRLHQPGLRQVLLLPAHGGEPRSARRLHVRGHRGRDPGRLRRAAGRRRRARDRLRRSGARHAAACARGRPLGEPLQHLRAGRRGGADPARRDRCGAERRTSTPIWCSSRPRRAARCSRPARSPMPAACRGTASTTTSARLTTNVLRRFAEPGAVRVRARREASRALTAGARAAVARMLQRAAFVKHSENNAGSLRRL